MHDANYKLCQQGCFPYNNSKQTTQQANDKNLVILRLYSTVVHQISVSCFWSTCTNEHCQTMTFCFNGRLSYRTYSLLSLKMLVLCGTTKILLSIYKLKMHILNACTPGKKIDKHLYCEKYCNAITWSTVLKELHVWTTMQIYLPELSFHWTIKEK